MFSVDFTVYFFIEFCCGFRGTFLVLFWNLFLRVFFLGLLRRVFDVRSFGFSFRF